MLRVCRVPEQRTGNVKCVFRLTGLHLTKRPPRFCFVMSRSARTLVIGGGGGGDALAALVVADTLGLDRANTAFGTLVWERTLYDPAPGPRAPEDFARITQHGPLNHRVTADSTLKGDAMTFVPRLADAFDVEYYLMDVTRGAQRVRAQINALQDDLGFDTVIVVDVGGDILARGDEEALRSPLADGLILAGTEGLNADVQVAVTGIGLDGELDEEDLVDVYRDLIDGSSDSGAPDLQAGVDRYVISEAAAQDVAPVFEWLPSEVSGLTCAAALGHRGVAEIRSSGLRVDLSPESHTLYVLPHQRVMDRNEIAQAFRETASMEDAEAALRAYGRRPETDRERESRARLQRQVQCRTADPDCAHLEEELLAYSRRMRDDDVRYLSIRRIARVLGLQRHELEHLKGHLATAHPDRYQPPVWACAPEDGRPASPDPQTASATRYAGDAG